MFPKAKVLVVAVGLLVGLTGAQTRRLSQRDAGTSMPMDSAIYSGRTARFASLRSPRGQLRGNPGIETVRILNESAKRITFHTYKTATRPMGGAQFHGLFLRR